MAVDLLLVAATLEQGVALPFVVVGVQLVLEASLVAGLDASVAGEVAAGVVVVGQEHVGADLWCQDLFL